MVARRQFSREFKMEAVKLVVERGVAGSQVAKEAKHRGIWPVAIMSGTFGVSRSGVYA